MPYLLLWLLMPSGSFIARMARSVMFSGDCAHGGAATNYPQETFRGFICFTRKPGYQPGNETFYPDRSHPDVPNDYHSPTKQELRQKQRGKITLPVKSYIINNYYYFILNKVYLYTHNK
jgi:hypothetical protein